MSELRSILESSYPKQLASAAADAFEEIEKYFQARKWKASELDAGHFVEAIRRIVEHELTGKHTPVGSKLPNFTDTVLKDYERQSGHESLRILIPRVLWAIYAIRNKRGVAHVGEVSPNELDATTIVRMSKWVLGELARLGSNRTADETESLLHRIVQRETPTVWVVDGRERVLDTAMTTSDKILVLLYARSPRSASELQEATEYKNVSNFRKILEGLHKKKLIDVDAGWRCNISPTGESTAEKLLHE